MGFWQRLVGRSSSSPVDRLKGDSAPFATEPGSPPVPTDRTVLQNPTDDSEAAQGHSSWTSLHRAARRGDIVAVKLLLAEGADINARSSIDETPLFLALEHKAAVELLLANGANANIKRSDGWTPLHWAALYGHKDVLELLLCNGAQVNALSKDFRTPL